MARPKGSFKVPSYRLHKATQQAVVTVNGRDHYLGTINSPESHERYKRLIGEWLAQGQQRPTVHGATITEVCAGFWHHGKSYYHRHVNNYRVPIRVLNEMYGTTPAAEFGPLKLQAVRERFATRTRRTRFGTDVPVCRVYVNELTERVRLIFQWAAEKELIPGEVHTALSKVRRLAKGRCEVYEKPKVTTIDAQHVAAVLAYLNPEVRAMVEVQLLTGMRPGEVCMLRGTDIDMSGAAWLYKPEFHKNTWRGFDRAIRIGPRAQELLRPHLTTEVNAYLFSPRRAELWRRQQGVSGGRAMSGLAVRYCSRSYWKAIVAACDRADAQAHKDRPEIPAEQRIVERWHPNQLRHNCATLLRQLFGIEAARVILGHGNITTTQIYAEADSKRAGEIMAEVG